MVMMMTERERKKEEGREKESETFDRKKRYMLYNYCHLRCVRKNVAMSESMGG